MFNASLLTISHSLIFVNSLLSPIASWPSPNEFVVVTSVVSSSYIIHLNTLLEKTMSFTYIVNNNGPNIEPCGTPVKMLALQDTVLSNSTCCLWLDR